MINNRQKQMINDLERSAAIVTARQLSEKYGISLRTVRSDISAIADYLKDKNVEFIRIPSQGMRIISDGKFSSGLNRTLKNREFIYLDETQRSILLLMKIYFAEGPVSIADLCEIFDVSRSTILTSVKHAKKILKDRHIRIERYQNRGYRLEASIKNIIRGFEEVIRLQGEEVIYSTLTCRENGLVSEAFEQKIADALQFIANDLSLYISHHLFLSFMLSCLIRHAKTKSHVSHHRSDEQEEKLQKLIRFLEDAFSIVFHKEAVNMLKYLLNSSTDYSANIADSDSDLWLPAAVDELIAYVNKSGMYQINDADTLRVDLLIHLKSTIDAIASGLPRDNPLLDEIRSSYPNEFNLIKSAAQRFSRAYPLKLDDNEIGYLTLYFLRSFDKVEKMQDTRVMVVCNTGRSASKLLATRLINNIPDIHIVSMNSIYNISNNPGVLDNIDFVISTIPLSDISKPYIVISPLLQKNEISKVKEAIWLSKSEIQISDNIDKVASSMLEEHQQLEDTEMPPIREYYDAKNIIPNNVISLLGEVSMNLFSLISDLYPKGIPASAYSNLSGIYAHVLMSVSRWQRKEFIEPWDDEQLISENRKQYEAIRRYLRQESERLNVFIPDSEIIAILRYYLY